MNREDDYFKFVCRDCEVETILSVAGGDLNCSCPEESRPERFEFTTLHDGSAFKRGQWYVLSEIAAGCFT
jgi:hypothetical protein